MSHLVSVLMPTYNCEKYISRAINSVFAQTHSNLELLVSDGASADNTKKIIDSFDDKRIRRFHSNSNLSYLKTWNKLIENAKGDFITFQDGDDWSDPNRIQLFLKEFEKDPELKMIGSNCMRVDENGANPQEISFPAAYSELKKMLPDKFPFIGSALMIRRELYNLYGGYNEFFDRIGSEDLYWGAKLLLRHKMININKPLYYYRINPTSHSKRVDRPARQAYSKDLAVYLIKQQIGSGTDDLENKNTHKLKMTESRIEIKHLFWKNEYAPAFRKAMKLILYRPIQPWDFYQNLFKYFKKWMKKK